MSANPNFQVHNRIIAAVAMVAAMMLLAESPVQAETRTWSGPVSGNWFTVSNWLPNDNYPQSGDTAVVTNGSILLTNETASLAAFSITNATLVFSNWSTRLVATNVTMHNNTVLTLPAAFANSQMSNRVWVACSNFTINVGGQINADGRGFARTSGRAPGGAGGFSGAGGAGHGGRGGSGNAGVAGLVYGSTNQPIDPGSGGGDGANATTGQGGNGGGVVRLEATGTVTIGGIVTANGGDGANGGSTYRGGGGSGGSIFITCETFGGSTNGYLRANGGQGAAATGGGGGGGRIAVNYTSVSAGAGVRFSAGRGSGRVNVDANAPLDVQAAQVGTLSFPDSSMLDTVLATWNGTVSWLNGYVFLQSTNVWIPDRLTLSNCTVGVPVGYGMRITNDLTVTATGGVVVAAYANLTCDGNLLLTNGASLVAYGGETNAGIANRYGALVQVSNTLTVASNSWIYPFAHSTNGGAVRFRVGDLVIRSGGGISATNRGYGRVAGLGKGVTGGSSTGGSGGGHGGKGGNGSGATAGNPYGSTNTPIAPGSGGGDGYSAAGALGGHGGGTVWIEADGGVTLEGAILANGENGRMNTAAYQSGGGAGGSIFMMCDTFCGTGGVMEAKGGNGGGTLGGSGGGGRISIAIGLSDSDRAKLMAGQEIAGLVANLQEPSFSGTISVTNGIGWTNLPPGGAAAGSRQFLKVQAANERFVTIDGIPGQYGSPTPNSYASWPVEDGTVFTNSVATPADELNGLRRACTGWTLKDTALGTPITNKATAQAVFTLNTNVTLTWLWTNEYQLAFAPGPNGSVNSNLLNGWYTNGTPVTTIEASPDPGYYFVAWIGTDVPGAPVTNNPLTVTMDRARTNITAAFASRSGVTMRWTGSGNWMSLTNWSPSGVPGTNDQVFLQSGTSTVSEAYRIGELVITNGATLVFSNWNTCLTAGDVTVLSNGLMTLPAAFTEAQMSNRIWVVCENFTLAAGGRVLADTRGYAGINGTGKGTSSGVTIGHGGGGGGYGGKGGKGAGASSGIAYGATNAPLSPGSGGGHGFSVAGAAGGAGGGAIRIEASNSMTIDGAVTANGGAGYQSSTYVSGGGSGGSIYMTCKTFEGNANGTLQAKGGAGGGSVGGGAGGGRIAVWIGLSDEQKDWVLADDLTRMSVESTNRFFAGTLSVARGTGWSNYPPDGAESGSLHFITPTLPRGTVFSVR